MKKKILMFLISGLLLALISAQGFAQTRPEYIPLGGGVKESFIDRTPIQHRMSR